MKAHGSIFSHAEEVEKSGCEEWRGGFPIHLSPEAIKQAQEWQAQDKCGMLDFGPSFIYSCSLENVPRKMAEPARVVDKPQRTNWDGCLKYEPAEVELDGVLKRVVFPGIPNFESVENGDEPEPTLILTLDSPVCVKGTGLPGDAFTGQNEEGVLELQTNQLGAEGSALIGRRVRIKGTLTHSISGHHHTSVMLDARSWTLQQK